MHFPTLLVAAVAALAGLTLAAPPQYGPGRPNTSRRGTPQSSTTTSCVTKMATTRGLWNTQTTWTTTYTPCTVTSTTTVTTTSTPGQVTETETETETETTTANTITSTGTETITNTETETSTTTDTSTTETTTTTDTFTMVTVSTTAGFIPIRTSVPNSSYGSSAGSFPFKRQAFGGGYNAPGRNGRKGNPAFSSNTKSSAWKFPQGVDCVKWQPSQPCSTTIATATSTVTAPTPPPTTTTETTTETSTSFPGATTTVTEITSTTTTEIASTTTVTTETVTETQTSTSSHYAACASANAADRINDMNINNLYQDTIAANIINSLGVYDSAYECCVAQLLTNPTAEVYFYNFINDRTCYSLQYGNVCAQASNPWTPLLGGTYDSTVGNLQCGLYVPPPQ